jgi:hypothetical protein
MVSFVPSNHIWLQATTVKIWNLCESSVEIPIVSGCGIIFDIDEIWRAVISNGKKEFLQMTRAMGQEKNKWTRESVKWEQREQDVSKGVELMEREILSLIGIIFKENVYCSLTLWLGFKPSRCIVFNFLCLVFCFHVLAVWQNHLKK